MSYGNQEYGGGGGGASNNYYDQSQNFSGRNENSYEGRSEGRNDSYGSHNQGGNGGYGQEQSYGRQESHGGNGGYGNSNESYGNQGGNGGYGRQEESRGRQEGRHNSNSNYDDDLSSAASHAQEHHSSEDKSLFSSALSFIQERKGQYSGSEIDEQHAVNAHQAMYGSGSSQGQTHDSETVGAGAAMQALKMFTGGGSGSSGSSSGGMDKNKLIGLAMAQAGKLWDEKQGSGGNVSGDKQSAVNSAAEMALKMYMKNQGGGSSSGGAGGLLSLASKFL